MLDFHVLTSTIAQLSEDMVKGSGPDGLLDEIILHQKNIQRLGSNLNFDLQNTKRKINKLDKRYCILNRKKRE